jgi:hypothetical protein
MVLVVDELKVSRSLRRSVKRGVFRVTLDTAFTDVMIVCVIIFCYGQDGIWIILGMVEAYGELHRRGVVYFAEAWWGDALVGGLYGFSLGAVFFGEFMFSFEPDASKTAFVALVEQLRRWSISLVDCQVYTLTREPRRPRVAAPPVPRSAPRTPREEDAPQPLALRRKRFRLALSQNRSRPNANPSGNQSRSAETARRRASKMSMSSGSKLSITSGRPVSGCGRARRRA